MQALNIGQAAQAAGVSAKMIRHYERIGLVPAAPRTDAGYRQYGEREVSVLRFIRQARRMGFSIEQIEQLLGLWSNTRRASRKVKALAEQHVAELEQKLREMAEMKRALEGLIAACRGDEHAHCAILDGLAAGSAQAPEARSAAGKPGARKAGAKPKAKSPAADAAGAEAHRALMAWTLRRPARPAPRRGSTRTTPPTA